MAKGYRAQIGLDTSDADKKINSLNKELKSVDNSLKTSAGNAELLSQKYQLMGEQVQALSQKLQTLTGARSDVMTAFQNGQISDEDLRSYEREVINTRSELAGMVTSLVDTDKAFALLGEGIKKVTQLTAAFVKEAIQVGKTFESSMSQVAATMAIDKTSDDFERMSKAAKDAGASTKYTAAQAADALNYLALAGYSADEAISSLDKVLDLATAGGMDLARASDMLTDTISALRLDKTDMDELIDKMSVTAQKTNTTVEMLGDALLQVGGTAANIAGRDGGITELTSVLGILANSGIKASEGGTHLRNILLKMSKPTKNTKALLDTLGMSFYDLEGNMRPIPDIFVEMKTKMDELGLSNQERDSLINKAFNPTDLASVNALLNTTEEQFKALADEIDNCQGAADSMGKTMQSNLDGALRTLQSAKEAVQVELYEQIQEPLAKLANIAATALQDVSKEIQEAGLGEEFNTALSKIAEAAEKALPKIKELFKQFAEDIVPRLGDVAVKITDITTDKVLPKMLDLFEWLIDHGSEVEGAIKLIVVAMATGKVMNFTTGISDLIGKLGALSTAAGSAGGAIAGATGEMAAQTTALGGGTAGLIGSMNAYVLIIEAVAAAALLAADAIDKQTQKIVEQNKVAGGFSEYGNDLLDEYTELSSGKSEKTSAQLKEDIEKNKADLDHMQKQLQYLKKLGDEAEESGDWNAYNDYYRKIGFDEEQLKRNIELLENTIHQEEKLFAEKDAAEKKAIEDERINSQMQENSAAYSASKKEQMRMENDPVYAEAKRKEAAEADEKARAEAFAENLEAQEDEWDKYYHWDKENYDEYWQKKWEWLEENKVDTQEWWEAHNKTKEKLDKQGAKKAAKSTKDAATIIKEAFTSFKNGVELEVEQAKAAGEDEYKAELAGLDKIGDYLETKLDHNSDLYKTEYASYLKKRRTVLENQTTAEKKLNEDNVKAQKAAIEDYFDDLENEAKRQQWSDRELHEAKKQYLEEHYKNGEIFLENYEEQSQKLQDKEADIIKSEIEAEEKKRKTILTEAEKAAEKLVSAYESRYSAIMSAVDSPQKVTDKNGNKRLVFSDYKKKLAELKEYQSNIGKLKDLGLSSGHLNEIFSMNFDTRALYIKELLNMGAADRERYLKDYEAYSKTASDVAQQELDFDTQLTSDINKIFEDIDGYSLGSKTAAEWLRGVEDGLKGTQLEGYELSNVVDPETINGAATWNGMHAVGDVMKNLGETFAVSNTLKALPDAFKAAVEGINIVINVDGEKAVRKTVKQMTKETANSGAKGVI